MIAPAKNLRDLLSAIGMGHFNATMTIPYLMISPATTDPKAAQVILVVQHLQNALNDLGANLQIGGQLDAPTAAALQAVVGPGWAGMPWSASISAVVNARDIGWRFPAPDDDSIPMAVGGPLDFLPDVPGGMFTYAVAAYLIYRHFTKRKDAR